MGADVHKKEVVDLAKYEEGQIIVLIQSWEEPAQKAIDEIIITEARAEPMFHYLYCGGLVQLIKITDNKQVLFCKGCGLRLEIKATSTLRTVQDLRNYFN